LVQLIRYNLIGIHHFKHTYFLFLSNANIIKLLNLNEYGQCALQGICKALFTLKYFEFTEYSIVKSSMYKIHNTELTQFDNVYVSFAAQKI